MYNLTFWKFHGLSELRREYKTERYCKYVPINPLYPSMYCCDPLHRHMYVHMHMYVCNNTRPANVQKTKTMFVQSLYYSRLFPHAFLFRALPVFHAKP